MPSPVRPSVRLSVNVQSLTFDLGPIDLKFALLDTLV